MSSSLAGSWGEKKLKDMNLKDPMFGLTTNNELFGIEHIQHAKEKASHPMGKYRNAKENHKWQLTYTDVSVHAMHSQAWEEASEAGESTASNTAAAAEDLEKVQMGRTFQRLLKEGDAPVAIGRSGHRQEQGINASGLLGERLLVSDEPSRNTFVQRSWLPHDDPALIIKCEGIPEAFMPNDVSLDLGPNSETKSGWVHQREATFTGQPLSKVGARRAGVFMDEFKADGSRQPVNP